MKAIVVAGGDAAPEDAAQLVGAEILIAADSGAEWLANHGATPDLVIGDMDSLDPALLDQLTSRGVTVERHAADKEESDAELALARAVAGGADQVVILGGLGGERLDHELANLLLLVDRRWDGIELRAVRGPTTVRPLHGGRRRDLYGAPGDLVTLLPVGGDAAGVTTTGLRFPLRSETLYVGRSRGLSNEVEQVPASVSLDGGTLLIVETRKESRA